MAFNKTTKVGMLLALSVIGAGTAWADRIPAVDGVYYADGPITTGENGPPQCATVATIKANQLSFAFQVFNDPKPLKYGTVTVPLDAAGGFHGKAALPSHAPFREIGFDSQEDKLRYRDLKEVVVDVDSIEVGGGGSAIILKVTVPTGRSEGDYCRRTLVHAPAKRPSGGPNAGHFYLKGTVGHGNAIRCPADAVIAGGKVYFTSADGYSSWSVEGAPLKKDGSFEATSSFAKPPADSVMEAAGWYRDQIKAMRSISTLNVKGRIQNVHAEATGLDGKALDIDIVDDAGFYKCEGHYYSDGFDAGGGFINCDKLSGAERERHPICN